MMSRFVRLCSFLTIAFVLSEAKILTSPADLTTTQYDFVIIGGGTAGSVLANRLSADPSTSVLVIEAGVDNEGILGVEVPFLGVTLPGTAVDWNYTTVPQVGLNNRVIPYTRGHVLGGSSSVNLMTYNRGSDDVWNRWANLTQDNGWSWNSVEKYYLKSSRLVPPADGHDDSQEVDHSPNVHGSGPVEVSVPGFPLPLDGVIVNASQQLGGRFAFNLDYNTGNFLGVGFMQSSIGGGERSSAATAYLAPVESNANLDILINTQVTKLVRSGTSKGKPVFKTVEIAQSSTSPRFVVNATKEVVLSAGVIGTPQILLLSGIGPSSDLQSHSIHTIIDLPDVGTNLADHPLVPNYYSVSTTGTWDDVLRNNTLFGDTLGEWMSDRQGLFVNSPGNTLAYMKLPSNASIFNTVNDPSAGPKSGNTELIFVDGFAQFGSTAQPATGNFISILTAVVSPTSRGTVKLNSADPFDKPLIDPALFTTDFDIFAIVQAMKDAQTILSSPAFQTTTPFGTFAPQPFGDFASATTDELKAQFARQNSVTVNHPVGTAPMSPTGSKHGVVDSNLKLKGALGLRVVDASVFPVIPECHTQGLVYIIAERAADLIKTEYGLPA